MTWQCGTLCTPLASTAWYVCNSVWMNCGIHMNVCMSRRAITKPLHPMIVQVECLCLCLPCVVHTYVHTYLKLVQMSNVTRTMLELIHTYLNCKVVQYVLYVFMHALWGGWVYLAVLLRMYILFHVQQLALLHTYVRIIIMLTCCLMLPPCPVGGCTQEQVERRDRGCRDGWSREATEGTPDILDKHDTLPFTNTYATSTSTLYRISLIICT